jgi:hypothetical protein
MQLRRNYLSRSSGGRRRLSGPRGRRSASVCAVAATVALASAISVACSSGATPHPASAAPPPASSTTARPASSTAQARDLEGRVDLSRYFKGCDASAQPIAGAEGIIKCQPRQRGIAVSASSFRITGPDIPFFPSYAAGESSDLNNFLKSILPSGLSGTLTSATPNGTASGAVCLIQQTATCLRVGYSGFWGNPDVLFGRLYCYERSGSVYIVATFDNDSYESSFDQDFVVIASAESLTALRQWWEQNPING